MCNCGTCLECLEAEAFSQVVTTGRVEMELPGTGLILKMEWPDGSNEEG